MMFYSKEAAIKHANARAKQTNKNYVVIQDEPDLGLCESVPLDTWNDSPFFQGCKDSQCIHTTCYPEDDPAPMFGYSTPRTYQGAPAGS